MRLVTTLNYAYIIFNCAIAIFQVRCSRHGRQQLALKQEESARLQQHAVISSREINFRGSRERGRKSESSETRLALLLGDCETRDALGEQRESAAINANKIGGDERIS